MASDGDNLHASIAHIVLACVAGNGLSRMKSASYTHPGMHANFFIHGVIGFLNYQKGLVSENDIKTLYKISLNAARYLALPCLNADLRRDDMNLSLLHLLSGLVPFVISLTQKDCPLGNLAIAVNIISLCQYSHHHKREFGWYTAGAACVAYFATPLAKQKFIFPLALAVMNYCAYRIWHVHYDAPIPPPGARR